MLLVTTSNLPNFKLSFLSVTLTIDYHTITIDFELLFLSKPNKIMLFKIHDNLNIYSINYK